MHKIHKTHKGSRAYEEVSRIARTKNGKHAACESRTNKWQHRVATVDNHMSKLEALQD